MTVDYTNRRSAADYLDGALYWASLAEDASDEPARCQALAELARVHIMLADHMVKLETSDASGGGQSDG